jgi:hypothetical protein
MYDTDGGSTMGMVWETAQMCSHTHAVVVPTFRTCCGVIVHGSELSSKVYRSKCLIYTCAVKCNSNIHNVKSRGTEHVSSQ